MTESNSLPSALQERFTDLEPFADGDTGPSFLATEQGSGRRGLLKLVRARLVAIAAERQRIKRELSRQATLSHPHLAVPLASGETEGTVWFFRELVEGTPLRQRLDEEGALPSAEALVVAAQLATALSELHQAGLLHRDLAPHHVILRPDPSGLPHAVLVDASLAAPIEGAPPEAVGTPDYVAPELLGGRLASFRSDLYSLGVVLFEMATGELPFEGADPAERMAARTRGEPRDVGERLPEPARELLGRLLARSPKSRPFSAADVRKVLEPLLPEGYRLPEPTPRKGAARKRTILGMPAVGGSAPPPPPTSVPPSPPSPSQAPPAPPGGSRPPSPPVAEKKTMLGMPAAPTGSAPPPPPGGSSAPSAPPPPPGGSSAPSAPPPPPSQAPPSPPVAEKKTMLGMPAATPGGSQAPAAEAPADGAKPHAQDPTMQLDALDVEQHEVEPPPELKGMAPTPAPAPEAPAGEEPKPFAQDPTMQLSPVDLEQSAVEAPAEIADMAPTPAPAPEAPQGAASVPPAEAAQFEAAAADVTPPPGVAPLDFDEEAETVLRDGSAAPAPAAQQPPTATPAGQRAVETVPGTVAAPAEASGGMGRTIGAFLAGVALMGVVGWFVLGGRDEEPEPAAAKPALAARQHDTKEPVAKQPEPAAEPPKQPAEGEQPGEAPATDMGQEAAAQAGSEGTGAEAEDGEPAAKEPAEQGSASSAAQEAEGEQATAEGEPAEQGGEGAGQAEGGEPAAKEPAAEAPQASERPAGQRRGERASARRSTRRRAGRASSGGAGQAGSTASTAGSPFEQVRAQAKAAFRSGNFAQAAALYARATAMNPRHAGSFAGLGASKLRLGDYRGAIAAYQKAVRLKPNNANYLAALGHAYFAAGDRARAAAAYQRALAVNPNHRGARQGMQRLGR